MHSGNRLLKTHDFDSFSLLSKFSRAMRNRNCVSRIVAAFLHAQNCSPKRNIAPIILGQYST